MREDNQLPASNRKYALTLWVISWVVLPNLFFGLVSWFVGGPPRYTDVVITGVVGLVARKFSFPVQFAAFCGTLAYLTVSFIAGLFRMSIMTVAEWAPAVRYLKPLSSPEYIILLAAMVVTLVVGWRLLRMSNHFSRISELVAAVTLILSFAGVEVATAAASTDSYDRYPPAGTPFLSSTQQTRFFELGRGNHHLLKIMVEAMGVPNDPVLRQRLFHRFQQPDIQRLYYVESGTNPFFGMTTNAEMRGLCGRWGDYYEVLGHVDRDCLPARLAQKGYHTVAMHSFTGEMFERTQWYPNIGFQELVFRDELVREGAGRCGGVFPAACDRDVPRLIGQRLKNADRKLFINWLTVNTHLPVIADASLHTEDCAAAHSTAAPNHQMTCRLFALWDELFDNLAKMLVDPDLPATNVLISGDHAPPFLLRSERAMFDEQHIPWIVLKRKPGPVGQIGRNAVAAVPKAASGAPSQG